MQKTCEAGQLCWDAVILELIKGLPTAFVALVIGAIAANIAYRQYRVARGKLNLDLFEERFKVYELIFNFLSFCHHSEGADFQRRETAVAAFEEARQKTFFLFGRRAEAYLQYLERLYHDRESAMARIAEAKESETCEQEHKAIDNANVLLSREFRVLHEHFRVYMNFEEWRGKPEFSSFGV